MSENELRQRKRYGTIIVMIGIVVTVIMFTLMSNASIYDPSRFDPAFIDALAITGVITAVIGICYRQGGLSDNR